MENTEGWAWLEGHLHLELDDRSNPLASAVERSVVLKVLYCRRCGSIVPNMGKELHDKFFHAPKQ